MWGSECEGKRGELEIDRGVGLTQELGDSETDSRHLEGVRFDDSNVSRDLVILWGIWLVCEVEIVKLVDFN